MLISANQSKKIYLNTMKEKHLRNKVVGNYLIRQKIGKGGFAQVFKARHLQTSELVAIKTINKSQLGPQDLERLKKQISIHSKLIHSNIVKIYQAIQTQNKIFIVMEYIPKGELFELVTKNGKMSQKLSAKIFLQILSALLYLHQQGIAHLDVKTENIILDDQMNAKLIDFGLAQKYTPFEMLKTICGSPCYLAPQMVLKEKYNPQLVDVWCLGVTLYIMVFQKYPFEGSDYQAMKQSIIKCKYTHQNDLSKDLKQVFQKIFTAANKRITLKQLKQTNFAKKAPKIVIKSVNTQKQKINIDENILLIIEKKYSIPSQEIKQSLINFKLDDKSALYYLIMKKNIDKGLISKYDLISAYLKQQMVQNSRHLVVSKNKSKKFQISHQEEQKYSKPFFTPRKQLKKDSLQENSIHKLKARQFYIRPRKLRVSIQNSRLRKMDQSPESPKRILDRVGAYHATENQTQY